MIISDSERSLIVNAINMAIDQWRTDAERMRRIEPKTAKNTRLARQFIYQTEQAGALLDRIENAISIKLELPR